MLFSLRFCFLAVVFLSLCRGALATLQEFVYSSGADLSQADVVLLGENADDGVGYKTAAAGDFDQDGHADILVGAPYNDEGAISGGKIYLMLGSDLLQGGNLDSAFASITSARRVGNFGASLCSPGDLDGDGYPEIAVGAPGADKVYFFWGSVLAAGGAFTQADADIVFGGTSKGRFGASLAAVDVDGDGLLDLVMGAPHEAVLSSEHAGQIYIMRGSTILSSSGSINFSGTDQPDYKFYGTRSYDSAGVSVANAGDVDNDGKDDLLVGAPDYLFWNQESRAFLLFGRDIVESVTKYSYTLYLDEIGIMFTSQSTLDMVGKAASGMGDLDGDGYGEIAIGAPGGDAVYFFRGSLIANEPAGTVIDLRNASAFYSPASHSFVGEQLCNLGDINNDGFNDLGLIGLQSAAILDGADIVSNMQGALAPYDYHANEVSQCSYFLPGASGSPYEIANAGDVDGNGVNDVLVGAYYAGPAKEGEAYLIFSDTDCAAPAGSVYVDGNIGHRGSSGASNCPLDTIQIGLQKAVEVGATQVVVKGFCIYEEQLQMVEGISVVGDIQFLPPILRNTNDAYSVIAADNAALKYFYIIGGGLYLNSATNVIVEENLFKVYRIQDGVHFDHYAVKMDHARHNTFQNNIFAYADTMNEPFNILLYIGEQSGNNRFVNNTFHGVTAGGYWLTAGVLLYQNALANNFINNIIHFDTTAGVEDTSAHGFYAVDAASTRIYASYNKISVNNAVSTYRTILSANNDIGGDPDFYNPIPRALDYRLRSTSPCIDAGSAAVIYNDVDGTRNDQGAYGGPNSLDFAP